MNILIIEDEVKVANHLKQGLEENGYQAHIAYDGAMGLKLYQQNKYDLILLDAILPGKNGFELCQEIRRSDIDTKIIMLTALGTTDDKVEGLESGADDYVVKPFDFRELLARIKVVCKRKPTPDRPSPSIKIADLELDLSKKVAKRNQQTIDLTAKEYSLLEFLMRNKGRVLSRVEIIERVWELDFDTGTNVVDVYVNILRKKIDKNSDRKLIHTRVGMGYYIDDRG
ncbi:two-component system response regulator [Fulvivirga imtechensis AK7]|uniref:Two-component system response regulator n=1 Tax=Fulvivirga imtechensis AK7 TaxID=1237149 RepID=L8JTJ4_9BACT|nr:response regulator transcription factor [Fulvivirga imtechensis]ELR71563.1 two-component system response regulator [Fulvivirga imtechensis AK7]